VDAGQNGLGLPAPVSKRFTPTSVQLKLGDPCGHFATPEWLAILEPILSESLPGHTIQRREPGALRLRISVRWTP
jgi:hypothetical protein